VPLDVSVVVHIARGHTVARAIFQHRQSNYFFFF
jgi:hypothetical protein